LTSKGLAAMTMEDRKPSTEGGFLTFDVKTAAMSESLGEPKFLAPQLVGRKL